MYDIVFYWARLYWGKNEELERSALSRYFLSLVSIFRLFQLKDFFGGHGGGIVVSALTFYSNDPGLNPAGF